MPGEASEKGGQDAPVEVDLSASGIRNDRAPAESPIASATPPAGSGPKPSSARSIPPEAATLLAESQPGRVPTGDRVDSENAMAATLLASPAGAPSELAPGTLLDGVYRVEKLIGRGAMGAVYLVQHLRLNRRFAAKVVSERVAGADPDIGMRLRNEARVASTIQHENIVDVTHLGETPDGSLFIVMELLQGRDLRSRMLAQADPGAESATRWLPDDEVRVIARGLLAGLAAAHAAGIVHRDLKPDNVFLVSRTGRIQPKIVDFGISKATTGNQDLHLTRTGQIIGTPLYMAPEQSRSTADVDSRADLYSMGVVLFELVTGQLPFEATSLYDIIVKHATEPPRKPTSLRPELSPAVEAVILRCLEKKPGDRFASADALLEAWERAWDHGEMPAGSTKPVPAQSVPAAQPAPPPAPIAAREPSRRGLIAAGVVVAVLVSAVGWLAFGSGEPQALPPSTTLAAPPSSTVAEPVIAPPAETEAAPPQTTVAPAPATYAHVVHSTPEGAHVLRDGTDVGTTPYAFTLAAGESAALEVRLHGYRRETLTVRAEDDEAGPVITLRHAATAERPPDLAPR